MKKLFAKASVATIASVLLSTMVMALPAQASVLPNWNVTGSHVVAFNYLGTDYAHDMTLAQDGLGNISGSGGNPAGGPHVYTWILTSGIVSGDAIDFYANYTATADAVTPQTVMHVMGTIASNGTMSGTWSDNYQGGERGGTWKTTSGAAVALGTLAAEDFGVVNYDVGGGLGFIKGYTAGFGVTDATLAGATSVVVQLFAGANVLQTNTAILPKFNADITGVQFSSPFDVSGTFNYATDGYWTNVRASEYGQSATATRVVATVTLANGKIVTAENTLLTGDAWTIFPVAPVMLPPTNKDQCKNDGWKVFTNPSFRNQGQCVSFVEHLKTHQGDNCTDNDKWKGKEGKDEEKRGDERGDKKGEGDQHSSGNVHHDTGESGHERR